MKKAFIILVCFFNLYGEGILEKFQSIIAPYQPKQPIPNFDQAICLAEKQARTKWISDDKAAQRVCCLNSSCGSILQGFYWIGKAAVLTGVVIFLHNGGVIDNGEIDTALASASYATLSGLAGYGLKKLYAGCMNKPAKEAALLSEKHWNKYVQKRLKVQELEEIRKEEEDDEQDQSSADDSPGGMELLHLQDTSNEDGEAST